VSGEHRRDGKRTDTIERAETTIQSNQSRALHRSAGLPSSPAILVTVIPISAARLPHTHE